MTKSILNREFVYTSAASTNIRLTFRRARQRMKEEAEARQQNELEQQAKVKELKRSAK